MNLIKKIMPAIILLGCIGLILTLLFGYNTLVNEYITPNGVKMYYIDIPQYAENINNAITGTPPPFETITPSRTWVAVAGTDWYKDLVNNLAYLFDWLYFPINVILYALRWVAWVYKIEFAVIGWPMKQINGSYQSVIIQILNWLSQNYMIPYI